MSTLSELNKLSKKSPTKLRIVSLYNIISFWFTVILSFSGILITLWFMPVEEMDILSISLLFILPIVLISISYIMLRVNLKLLKGSLIAYWVLLIYFALQCIGFGVAGTKFNFDLGGIPITFTFTMDDFFLKINIVAIILTGYLFGIRNQLPELLQKIKN